MARPRAKTLTGVELDIMQVVWAKGEVATEDIQAARRAQGGELSDGAARRMLAILVEKGYLARRRAGRGFLYRATVGREQATGKLAGELLKRAFGGNAANMVAALMDARAVRDEDIGQIERLIADRKREGER